MSMTQYRNLYFVGILAGVAVALLPLLTLWTGQQWLLLIVGVGHLIALISIGFRLPEDLRGMAGYQIQTAGYLHTLVGFTSTLIVLGISDDPAVKNVLGPMGSALLTSILGWLFGGELSTRSATREDDMLRAEATKVVEELRGFASGVRGAHEDYIRGVKGLLVGHEELEKKQREARERAIRTALELDEHIVSVGKQFEDLRSSLDDTVKTLRDKLGHEFRKEVAAVPTALGEVNTALRNVAESAKDTAKYLNESRLLIDQLEKLTDTIAGLRA